MPKGKDTGGSGEKEGTENQRSGDDSLYAREIADKVNYLFQNYRKPNLDRYSYSEVEELTGGKIDQSWISKLAHGQTIRPGIRVLKALTDFFQVDPVFWFKDLNDWIKEQETSKIPAEDENIGELYNVALRSMKAISPEDAHQVLMDLIKSLEKRNKGE